MAQEQWSRVLELAEGLIGFRDVDALAAQARAQIAEQKRLAAGRAEEQRAAAEQAGAWQAQQYAARKQAFAAREWQRVLELTGGIADYRDVNLLVLQARQQLAAAQAVCLLCVPPGKTGAAYLKPVHPLVGQAIAAWEQVRPGDQGPRREAKTGAVMEYLFCSRHQTIGRCYVNRVLIPLLCHKAGIPPADAHGPITCHRARDDCLPTLQCGPPAVGGGVTGVPRPCAQHVHPLLCATGAAPPGGRPSSLDTPSSG